MKKHKTRIVAALALAVSGVGGCAEPAGDPLAGGANQDEMVGEARQAVANSTVDTTDIYPHVVRILGINNSCSGTLISPRWVVTAAHCFQSVAQREGTVTVQFGPDSSAPTHEYYHTWDKSGPVFVGTTTYDYMDDDEIAKDMAAFRLDIRVPASVARPVHPEFGSTSSGICSLNAAGTMVGYGGDICGNSYFGKRNYASSNGWDRYIQSAGALLHNSWDSPTPCEVYQGSTGGDSGGPLFSGGRLCGIVSGHTGPIPWMPFPGVTLWNTTSSLAAFDTPFASAWLHNIELPSGLPAVPSLPGVPSGPGPIDAKGNWDGECAAYNACVNTGGGAICEKDTDGDGVIDLCDNCPMVFNPEQQVSDDDPDGDGVGAACDFCPTVKSNAQFPNQNYEAELAVAYPGEVKPPLPITASTPGWMTALATYKAAFKPDACDPVLSPVQKPLRSGALYDLPDIVQCTLANPTDCNCPLGKVCDWRVENEMRVSPYLHSNITHSPNDAATVGFRYCDCAEGTDIAGRVACQLSNDCPLADSDAYDDSFSDWKPIVHVDSITAGTSTAPGTEFVGPITANLDYVPIVEDWVFDATGMPVASTFDTKGNLISEQLHGVMWATTRLVNSSLPTEVSQFSHTYTYVNPRAFLASAPPSVPQLEDHAMRLFCKHCPFGVVDLFAQVGNPGLDRMTESGLAPQPGVVSTELRSLFSDVANGTKLYVPAAESMASRVQANDTVPMGMVLDYMDVIGRRIYSMQSRLDATPETSLPETVPNFRLLGTIINGTEGLSYLARSNQLFVMGGMTTFGGYTPKNKVVAYNLSTGEATTFDLDPGGMTKVLASMYRVEDNAFYLVDRDVQDVVTIKRWTPGQQPEALAWFDSSVLDVDAFYLVPSDDGVGFVVVVTGQPNYGGSALLYFRVNSSGTLYPLGSAEVMEDVLLAPSFVPGGLALSLRNPNYGLRLGVWDLTTPTVARSAPPSESSERTEVTASTEPVFLPASSMFSVE